MQLLKELFSLTVLCKNEQLCVLVLVCALSHMQMHTSKSFYKDNHLLASLIHTEKVI